MKVEETEYLVVYPGHNMTTLFFQRLSKKSCDAEIVGTPGKILRGCSRSILFKEKDLELVIAETKKMKLPPDAIYKIIRDGHNEFYEKI